MHVRNVAGWAVAISDKARRADRHASAVADKGRLLELSLQVLANGYVTFSNSFKLAAFRIQKLLIT